MKLGLKIAISIVSVLLTLILVFLGVYFFWPWNRDFFNNATEEFSIPGLDSKFVPQGFTKIEGYNKYLICGYMSDGSPSRYYVIDAETKNVDKWFTLRYNDLDLSIHAGGVASSGSTLWTVSKESDGKGYAFKFLLSDIMNMEESGYAIDVRYVFDTYNNADFVFTYDNMLWVGEFYRDDNYLTDTSHHVQTTSGETNRAMIYGFDIDEKNVAGVAIEFPQKAISVRNLAQGIAVTSSGNFVLSTSYGLANSHIYYYKDILNEPSQGKLVWAQNTIPLWYLDNNSLIKSIEIPSMSEEVVIENNRVYILFESACKKYKLFNRKRLDSVYSLPITYLEK
ncbi:MAG: hypothetical protein IJW59_04075 [Clostridia bacterium]|nr:hypothetical protein [Clostridia bacterium]